MSNDVVDLREFYISPLGLLVRRLLREKVTEIWPEVRGENILALGYGTPFLRPWLEGGATLLAAMPAHQGAVFWPKEGPNIVCLADLEDMPFPDSSIDRIILVHAVETTPNPDNLLEEVWRVLKPNGRVLFVVPNRRGLWALSDVTPFGVGRPYSASQLRKMLKDQSFFIERSWRALFAPPWTSRLGQVIGSWFERIGPVLCPAFGGLVLMEAGKQIYAPTLVNASARKRRLVLPLGTPSTPCPTRRV